MSKENAFHRLAELIAEIPKKKKKSAEKPAKKTSTSVPAFINPFHNI